MKSRLLASILALTVVSSYAQQANTEPENKPSVENSIFSIETGVTEASLIGLWGAYEQRLGNQFTLRVEAGVNLGFHSARLIGTNQFSGINVAFKPSFTLEPRFYLINRRASKGKDITNNSGTYFALQTYFTPRVYNTHSDVQQSVHEAYLSVIPSVGMRRTIGKRFFMEGALGLGVGYYSQYNFSEDVTYSGKSYSFNRAFNLHFRIGYRF